MEEIGELKRRLSGKRPAEWEALPDIGLYMDQLISYMPRQLIHYGEGETLTPAMVNNYIKDGMLPRAEGKRYSRIHLGYLTAICALKQALSVKDVGRLLRLGRGDRAPEALYAYFTRELDQALNDTAESLDENVAEEDLAALALSLALRSYADKVAAQRVLDILQARDGPQEPPEKDRGKGKK